MQDKQMENVKIFEFSGINYKIVKPSNKTRRESDAVYAKAYREAIAGGLFLEAEIEKILKERGLDRYSQEESRKETEKQIDRLLLKLSSCKSKEEGLPIVEQIKDLRKTLDEVDSARDELNSQSANLSAENKRFNYYAFACCTTEDGNKIWSSFKEFEEDDSDLANKAATEIMAFIYEGTQEILRQIEKMRPENEWLEKHGEKPAESFIDEAVKTKTTKQKKKTSAK